MCVFWLWFDVFQNKADMVQPSSLHSGEEAVPVMAVVMKELEEVMETL